YYHHPYYGYFHGYYGPAFRFGFGWGYPHIGLYYGGLPYGYYPFYWNSDPYYYYGGVFYQPYNGGYEVVAPPIGAAVPNLPSDARSILIDGVQYYEADGVYYQEEVDDDTGKTVYIVVGRDGVLNTAGDQASQPPISDNGDPLYDSAPAVTDNQPVVNDQPADNGQTIEIKVGDVVSELPDDCRKITLNKKKYYVSPDNVFYEDYTDADGSRVYRVASVPPQTDQAQDSQY
ncbi:MAG: hypothetical protein JST32_08385, partial [Bacteroidetes bacterium]|nr:hypothetical protein [Bacteroidota bacterium]